MSVTAKDVEHDMTNTKAEISTLLSDSDKLNEAIPTYERQVHKWKQEEYDAQHFERKVGDWLRCNKAHNQKTVLIAAEKLAKPTHKPLQSDAGSDSEAESMHSMDTARYIRASRQHSRVAKCTPMSTIKMYRTVPRKRDELRAKYGCAEYDEELQHQHRMQQLRHRRQQRLPARHCAYKANASASSSSQQRRKLLRKRRANSPLSKSSSEDECERDMPKRPCHVDTRPQRLANACHCRNAKSLCADALHYVNTSADKWLVENCAITKCVSKAKVKLMEQQAIAVNNVAAKPNTLDRLTGCSATKNLKCAMSNIQQLSTEQRLQRTSKRSKKRTADLSASRSASDDVASTSKTAHVEHTPMAKSNRSILLYAPSSNASKCSSFTLTEQNLGAVIGQRLASKYLKYHVGHRSFDSRCTVYYRPPQSSLDAAGDSYSASDEDIFERLERYGKVYAVHEQTAA